MVTSALKCPKGGDCVYTFADITKIMKLYIYINKSISNQNNIAIKIQ